jgi:sugar phosphate isomerase/epimerase
MHSDQSIGSRLGLSIPNEWWPAQPLLKEIEASGCGWVQLPSPPAAVVADSRNCIRHARAILAALDSTRLRSVLHAPADLLLGEPVADQALEGALSYAAECGAELVVYHARALFDGRRAEDRMLLEARSLAKLALVAERLGVGIALENLAPVFPGPETVSANPLALRALAKRINSPAVGLCMDVGHANIIAGLRRTSLARMVEPVLDMVTLFHLHDNLGARWHDPSPSPELDPLRLDLHLPLGRGNINWQDLAPSVLNHKAPLLLEIHPPRATPESLFKSATAALSPSPTPAHGAPAAGSRADAAVMVHPTLR